MTTTLLRKRLHEVIDHVESEDILKAIYTILQDRIKLENTVQPFTIDEFYERNEQSQLDIKNKNYLDHEAVKSKFGL